MGNTLTPRSKSKPSAFEIVELQPPADAGFSGTTLLRALTDAPLIEELIKRGYSVVDRKDEVA